MPDNRPNQKDAVATKGDRVVAVGASSGGMKALQTLFSRIPHTFPWPILLVQHLHPDSATHLPDILSRSSDLAFHLAKSGDRLRPGCVHMAPPRHHLILTTDFSLALNDNPKVHFSRPSIDIMFQSVAEVCGKQAIAVLLTGSNSDGADGIRAIKDHGGLTLVQSPETAESLRMPQAAIETGKVDHVLDLEAIAAKLIELSQQP